MSKLFNKIRPLTEDEIGDPPVLHIAIPVMNELEYLPKTLKSIGKQTIKNFKIHICVNQPNDWWYDEEKTSVCENNYKTIEYLRAFTDFHIELIDKSSKNYGWKGNEGGVGWARKVLMDSIVDQAKPSDIILSLDADTLFSQSYFESILDTFERFPDITALSIPYYHHLTEDAEINRAILHYEIYMRYYLINMFRINSPYAFTALGSAIAVPVWVYIVVSGITPKKSGEDFYFLQKLRKYGKVLSYNWNREKVFPASRLSDRVDFGTGPALIKGVKGDWSSYPIYDYRLFNKIGETYDLFPQLYKEDVETPMDNFLREQFKEDNIWQPLRENFKDKKHFVKACHEKIDGLRILQFLKYEQKKIDIPDEELFKIFMNRFFKEKDIEHLENDIKYLSFDFSNLFAINRIRDLLMKTEDIFRKQDIDKNLF